MNSIKGNILFPQDQKQWNYALIFNFKLRRDVFQILDHIWVLKFQKVNDNCMVELSQTFMYFTSDSDLTNVIRML